MHSRIFSRYSSIECLQQLYLSFVRPHLEYAVPVWDPHCLSHVDTLERVQKVSLRMIHGAWKENYNILLQRSGLQSLSDLRKYLKLCYLFQVMRGHFSCPVTLFSTNYFTLELLIIYHLLYLLFYIILYFSLMYCSA